MTVASRGVDRNLTAYGDPGFSRFVRRAFLASAGFDADDLTRPIVGIADTSSDYTTCHRQMPELVDAVRRGVLEAGALPVVFPTMSLPEILVSPTSMLYRNLLAMVTEESIRSQPMDAVVLVGGCDKTVPAQLMGAISADVPAVSLVAGPMVSSSFRGERVGACTDCRRLWLEHRAGRLDSEGIVEAQDRLCPTAGTCMVMGTASTMACVTEALGMMVAGGATPPAPTGARLSVGVRSGRLAAELAHEMAAEADGGARCGRRPADVLSAASFQNALTVLVALGGSTNAVIHLAAIAGRVGLRVGLDDLDRVAARVPLLVDCKPAGAGFLDDLDRAGGMPVVLAELAAAGLLDLDARTVSGDTMGDRVAASGRAPDWQRTVRTVAEPLGPPGSLRALHGSLAPGGAVLKVAAATPALCRHTGPALVFDGEADAAARLDDPALEVTADHVLVLRNTGPVGAGMPEAGSLPIPRRLAEGGLTDMVRVSDARMSGTAYGTVVLHVTPEAAAGGPLALVRDGDLIRLDVDEGRIDLLVDDDELARRRAGWTPPPPPARGWRRLVVDHIGSATLGADLDLLAPGEPPEES